MIKSFRSFAKSIIKIIQLSFINPGYFNPYIFYLYINNKKEEVPFRQVASLDSLNKFSNLLKSGGVDHYLFAGTLLGSIRQGAFAGRPSDIDLLIKENDFSSLLDLTELLLKNGYSIKKLRLNATQPYYKKITYQPKRGCHIDVQVFSLLPVEKNGINYFYWEGKKEYGVKSVTIKESQLLEPEESNIFHCTFQIPKKSEIILTQLYGEMWKIPTSRQYAWRKDDNN